jgi:hypothetical protein
MLSIMQGIVPRDEIEGLLAAQMAAVHNAAMTLARRLNQSRISRSRTAPAVTAIPNWTGRLSVNGYRLAGLYALWLIGRVAIAGSAI